MEWKVVRRLNAVEVRQMCCECGYYTRGCNEDYTHMLTDMCGKENLAKSDIEEIARDIVSHSDRKAFEAEHYLDCVLVVINDLLYISTSVAVKTNTAMVKLYKVKERAINGDEWFFDSIREVKKHAAKYLEECEDGCDLFYMVYDFETHEYRLMTAREEKEARLFH